MHRRAYLRAGGAALGVGLGGCLGGTGGGDGEESDGGGDGTAMTTADGGKITGETVATGLDVPWGAAYLDGVLHLTERPGRVVRIVDGRREVVAEFPDTATGGEGGLLGLAAHPTDPDAAYSYQTYDDGGRHNRIRRHDVADGWRAETLLDGIPGSTIHDGGRLFVRDGALYATTGDAREQDAAQDPAALNGSVLRLTLDGDPHPENPLDGPVFSYGHRNPQGLAVGTGEDADGALYATEHGPDTDDEINSLETGRNYGWPTVRGRESGDDDQFVPALASYTPTIAPGGLAIYPDDGPIEAWRGDLLFGTLAGTHLHRTALDGEEVADERHFADAFGRLRTTFVGPEGHLYVTTSNRDGRGRPDEDDDRLLRVVPR